MVGIDVSDCWVSCRTWGPPNFHSDGSKFLLWDPAPTSVQAPSGLYQTLLRVFVLAHCTQRSCATVFGAFCGNISHTTAVRHARKPDAQAT